MIGGGIVLGLLVTSAILWLMVDLRERRIASQQRELVRFGTLVAEVAERALQAIDFAERDVLEDMRHKGVETDAALAAYAGPESLHLQLRKRISGLPQVEALTIIDAGGTVQSFSKMWPGPHNNVVHRPYFQHAQAPGAPDVFLSLTVPVYGDGTPALFVNRRLTASDGRFLGLMVGRVAGSYFESLYKSIQLDGASNITLYMADGTMVLRYPAGPRIRRQIVPLGHPLA